MTDILYKIPVGDTLGAAWEKVKGSKGSFWAAIIIMILIGIGFGILMAVIKAGSAGAGSIIQFISSFINFFLQMGVMYMGIKRAQDLPMSYRDLFYPFRSDLIFKLIGLYILKILILLPFFLFFFLSMAVLDKPVMILFNIIVILGMIYVSVRMIMAAAYILDKTVNPWHSIVLSFKATRSNFWRMMALFIIQGFILLLGVITAGIGFIWILPFGFILYGFMYKRLSVNAPVI